MIPSSPLPDSGEGSDPRLLDEIRQRILRRGPMTFAEFMDLSLYHPRWGYYARPENPVGRSEEGDYYTAPARHPAFGALLGRQVAECLERVGGRERECVEFGPGGGELAASLLEELSRRNLGTRSEIRCTLVESNPHRRAAQERLLRSRGVADGVRWLTPREWGESTQPVRGCIVANEILDALPVHRIVFGKGQFREVWVGWEEGLVEFLGPVATDSVLDQVRADCPAPREGQELEVGMEAYRWVRRLGGRLARGYALLLDYGHLAPEVHSPRHHRGTLLAYHRHAAGEGYLERVGRQDLTAHVNFSALLETARSCGMETRGPVPQGRFLLALGALDWLADSEEDPTFEAYRNRKALQDLFLPGGMGESHQALVLATAGCELDLKGLRPVERWDPLSGA